MAVENRTRQIENRRRWLQRLIQFATLFAIAGAIALIWSLFGNPTSAGGPNGANSTILTTNSNSTTNSTAAGTDTDSTGVTEPATSESSAIGPKTASEDEIPVYIVGAIARPGIYIVKRGSYLYELVEMAGGMTSEAATLVVNLALKISDNQMIRIPTQSESTDQFSPHSFPTGANSATGDSNSSKTININTASQAELETLPGIGPATAAAIIAERTKNGQFKQIEDIMRVSGIKESRYAQLESLIRVQ